MLFNEFSFSPIQFKVLVDDDDDDDDDETRGAKDLLYGECLLDISFNSCRMAASLPHRSLSSLSSSSSLFDMVHHE